MCRFNINQKIEYAERHRDFDKSLAGAVLEQNPRLVNVQATRESRKLYNLCSKVHSELNHLVCFLRFNVNSTGILYAKHTPQNKIEDLILQFFIFRFPLFILVLESKRGIFVGYKNRIVKYEDSFENVMKKLEKIPKAELKDLEQFDNKIWESFYKSQIIKQRFNKKLFKKQIPKKYLKMQSFEIEKRDFENRSLNEF